MKNITLTFTAAQLSVLNAALIEMPYRTVAPLIQHINAQIQAQFDASTDSTDMPTGQTKPPDMFSGN